MTQEERAELVSRLFYLMTVKLEDAAAEAVTGQDVTIGAAAIEIADGIVGAARDIGILAEAAAALLRGETAPD